MESIIRAELEAMFPNERYLTPVMVQQYLEAKSLTSAYRIMHSKGFPIAPRVKGFQDMRVRKDQFAAWWASKHANCVPNLD